MTDSIPRDFIQLLISRVDLVDFIDSRFPLRKKSSSNYFACCPFHNEKTASFSVSQPKQFYYCFGCGAHGNIIDFLIQHDRLSFPEAIEFLAKHVGIEIPRNSSPTKKAPASGNLYDLIAKTVPFYQQQLKDSSVAINYLKKRNLTGAIAQQFQIGFATPAWHQIDQAFGKTPLLKQQLLEVGMLIRKEDGSFYDRFRERIMFPIHDHRGRIIGFGGRIIEQGEPKYLNSPETTIFQKGQELYGLYHALKIHSQLPKALIVEGYMDVIALFQHQITYAMATLGTATTANHLQRLLRYTKEIIFCFDGDEAGKKAAWRALLVALPLVTDGIQIKFLFLPDGEDPDTLVRKEGHLAFEKRIESALSLSIVFFQTLMTQTNLSSLDGRARLIKLATDHLNTLPQGVFRKMMFEELAKRARIETSQLLPTQSNKKPLIKAPKARTPSAVRLAISLLLQQPTLANLIEKPLPLLDLPGFDLLRTLYELILKTPSLTTGGLLEYWRDQEEGPILVKLANLEHIIPETGIEKEFLGAINHLKKLAHKQLIDKLLNKASQNDLTPEERNTLHELIHDKAHA